LRFEIALPLIPLVTLLSPPAVQGAHLEPVTSQAWEDYVKSATTQMEQRLNPGQSFLWADEEPDRLAKVRAGEIVVSQVGPQIPKKVPSGLIHDWVGAVFIPDVSINDAQQVLRDYPRYKDLYRPTVIDSKAIALGDNNDRFSMRLLNRSILLKTAFDAEYESSIVRVDDRCAYTIARTTRVREIEDYGSNSQRVFDEGEGHGFILSLFAITRLMQRDGGVYVELEAIGLSRDIPASMRWLIEPVVRRISGSSLATSLEQTQKAVMVRREMASKPVKPGISFQP
jgi:hypothetical protein